MPFHGVLGEDRSAKPLAILVRRLRGARGLAPIEVKAHGYAGCGQLLRKGHAQLAAWVKIGCVRAIVCHDADRDDPETRRQLVEREIIRASGVEIKCLASIPVQELEAWILADVNKLGELFRWCRGLDQPAHPESINDPKEYLIRLSRNPKNGQVYYHPPTHNEFMAKQVDLALVEARCPSFAHLAAFVRGE